MLISSIQDNKICFTRLLGGVSVIMDIEVLYKLKRTPPVRGINLIIVIIILEVISMEHRCGPLSSFEPLSVQTVFRSLYNTNMGLNNSQSVLIDLGPYLQSAFPLSSRAVKSWVHHSLINFHSIICSTNVYCILAKGSGAILDSR